MLIILKNGNCFIVSVKAIKRKSKFSLYFHWIPIHLVDTITIAKIAIQSDEYSHVPDISKRTIKFTLNKTNSAQRWVSDAIKHAQHNITKDEFRNEVRFSDLSCNRNYQKIRSRFFKIISFLMLKLR